MRLRHHRPQNLPKHLCLAPVNANEAVPVEVRQLHTAAQPDHLPLLRRLPSATHGVLPEVSGTAAAGMQPRLHVGSHSPGAGCTQVPFHLQGNVLYWFLLHLVCSAWLSPKLQLIKRTLMCSIVHHFFSIAYTYHRLSTSDLKASIRAGFFHSSQTYRLLMFLTGSALEG